MQDTDIIYNFQEKMAYVGAVDNMIPSLWSPIPAPPYIVTSPVTRNALVHLYLTVAVHSTGKVHLEYRFHWNLYYSIDTVKL